MAELISNAGCALSELSIRAEIVVLMIKRLLSLHCHFKTSNYHGLSDLKSRCGNIMKPDTGKCES